MSASEKTFGCAIFFGVREQLTTVARPAAFSRCRSAAAMLRLTKRFLFVDTSLRILRFPYGSKGFVTT